MEQPTSIDNFRASSNGLSADDLYYTLITGSSHGIGLAMATECAKRGMHLLLVALDNPDLKASAKALREEYKVQIHTLGIDLTGTDATLRVFEWTKQNGYKVINLINNAGFGRNGTFEKIPSREYHNMITLNNQVPVAMVHHFLPGMKKLAGAHILNLSSLEFIIPLPYKAVYTASKNFIYTFSLTLREELKDGNVKVSVLCPGPVITNEDGLERINSMGKSSKLMVMMPEEVAPIAINGMLAGKTVIIPGRVSGMIANIARMMPRSTKMSLLERLFRHYKDGTTTTEAFSSDK